MNGKFPVCDSNARRKLNPSKGQFSPRGRGMGQYHTHKATRAEAITVVNFLIKPNTNTKSGIIALLCQDSVTAGSRRQHRRQGCEDRGTGQFRDVNRPSLLRDRRRRQACPALSRPLPRHPTSEDAVRIWGRTLCTPRTGRNEQQSTIPEVAVDALGATETANCRRAPVRDGTRVPG